MGDRGNIAIRGGKYGANDRDPSVWFYTHWDGYRLPDLLAQALDSSAGRARARHHSYLARIIFCRLIREDVDGETGWGISTSLAADAGYPYLVVDPALQKVYVVPPTSNPQAVDEWIDDHPEAGLNYEEFIALVAQGGWDTLEVANAARIQ